MLDLAQVAGEVAGFVDAVVHFAFLVEVVDADEDGAAGGGGDGG